MRSHYAIKMRLINYIVVASALLRLSNTGSDREVRSLIFTIVVARLLYVAVAVLLTSHR